MGTMASINQNPPPLSIKLPDMRNLGVQLRVLVLANLMAVVAAVLLSETLLGAWQALLQISAAMQPVLLASMLLLFATHRRIARLPYAQGVLAVFLLVLSLTALLHAAANWLFGPEVAPSLLRLWFFAIVVTGTILAYFNMRGRALSPAITEARLQALQARIRPHFLFNCINAVLSLIRSDPHRAETALEDLADLFRVLMADNRQLVQLEGEVALCQQYLALEKLRLGERLNLVWHIEHMPKEALVPPLVLQPLLENAVYHGIEPSLEGGDVVIDIYRKGNEVHLTLINPYRRDGSHHSGNKMALSNIRERLALHFDAEAQLKIRVTDHQYQVHIVIPYRTEP
jgi:two-component system, LytTR family, sensor histidine kinase AlgZ